jgi:hypothetical protein
MNKKQKDLGVKIGTKAQILWEKVKTDTERSIKETEDSLTFYRATLIMAKQHIEAEKKKL